MPSPPDRIEEIVAGAMTISGKIRALDSEGHSRADIARLLGKRYQYVRNVLEGDKLRRASAAPAATPAGFGVEEQPSTYRSNIARLQLADDGSVRFPAWVLSALGLKPGAIIITEVGEDRLVLLTPKAAIRKVQAMARDLAPPDVLLSEELIADRRRENERESNEP